MIELRIQELCNALVRTDREFRADDFGLLNLAPLGAAVWHLQQALRIAQDGLPTARVDTHLEYARHALDGSRMLFGDELNRIWWKQIDAIKEAVHNAGNTD